MVEKCSVYLETSLVERIKDENVPTSTKKLNRMSDEYFSADDDENTPKIPSLAIEFSSINSNNEIKLSDKKELNSQISHEVVFQEENSTDERPDNTEDELLSGVNLYITPSNEPNDSSPHPSSSTAVNLILNDNFDEPTNHDNDDVGNDDDVYNDNVSHNDLHNIEKNNSVYYSDRVQLIEDIERNDFKDEQKAIGTTLMKQKKLISEQKRLNLEMLKIISQYENNRSENIICKKIVDKSGTTSDDDNSQESSSEATATSSVATNKSLSATPTSSRKKINDRNLVKSISKINFSENLNDYSVENDDNSNASDNNSNHNFDKLSKFNRFSSKSLSSDKSCQTLSFSNEDAIDNSKQECSSLQYDECRNSIASTSKSFTDGNDCQYSKAAINNTKSTSSIEKSSDHINTKTQQNDNDVPEENNKILGDDSKLESSNNQPPNFENNSASVPCSSTNIDGSNITNGSLNRTTSHLLASLDQSLDYDEDNWADCEDAYDMEEICTCQDYSDEDTHASSEDELPSRDVDLSCYTHLDSISEDILHVGNTETPRNHRKRKITETRTFCDGSNEVTSANRKRLALENVTLQKLPCTPTITSPSSVTSSAISEKRTPRSIIPTRDNPPPELSDWLLQFQRWSHVERLVAVDRLIEHCEPTQVRHMMKVIEPQFQRDFISLLPKELALQVLSYLKPRDLLRAAQTCRSWR